MSKRVSSPVLVGRDEEAERLRAAYRAASDGARILVVAGEAGVGKTRLAEDLVASVRQAGGAVVAGGCIDLGDHGVPFAPVVEGLRLLAREHPDLLDEAAESAGSESRRLLPGRPGRPSTAGPRVDDAGAGQARLYEAVLALIGRLGRDVPALVVLEDLHWADRSTRDLVRFLAHALRSEQVCLVLTYRSDDIHRRHPLAPVLVDLARSPRVEHLTLAGLGRAETSELVSAITGAVVDSARASAVFERSDGNPFFVEELIAAGREQPDGVVPESVRETIMVRIARLPPATQDLLRIASVTGPRVDHAFLADLAELTSDEVVDRIRPAVDSHLVVAEADPPAYAFRHALVAETLYDELLPAARTGRHVRAAELLEARALAGDGGSHAAIAHHWARAHRVAEALVASGRAADEAAALVAYGDVKAQLERVLALWPSVPDAEGQVGVDRATILRRTADAAAATGDFPRAIALGDDLIHELDPDRDPDRWLDAVHRVAWYHWDSGDSAGAAAKIDAGATVAERGSPESRVRYLVDLGTVHWSANRYTELAETLDAALAVPEVQAGPELTMARAMRGVALISLGRFDSGLADLDDADDPMESEEQHAFRTVWLTHALGVTGFHERAAEVGYAGLERLRRNGLFRRYGPYLVANQADPLFELGRWDESEALLRSLEWDTDDTSRAIPWVHESMSDIAAMRGEIAAAQAALDVANARVRPTDAIPDRMWLQRARGVLAAAEGRLADARAEFRAGIELSPAPESDRPLAFWIIKPALTTEAELAQRARVAGGSPADPDAAWRERLFDIADRIAADATTETAPGITLFAAHARAERARADGRWDADAWAQVVAAAERAGQPWDAARARIHEAEARLVVERDRPAARELLSAARAAAIELRARPLVERIERVAALGRIDLEGAMAAALPETPAGEPRDPFGLTERERQVLALIALGRTNRDIGAALFITDKTASSHVTHILDKLGVASRVEAALLAERRGLVDGRRNAESGADAERT